MTKKEKDIFAKIKKTASKISDELKKDAEQLKKEFGEASDATRDTLKKAEKLGRTAYGEAGNIGRNIYKKAEYRFGTDRMTGLKYGSAKGALAGVFAGPIGALKTTAIGATIGFLAGPKIKKWYNKKANDENVPETQKENTATSETPDIKESEPHDYPGKPGRPPRAFRVDAP